MDRVLGSYSPGQAARELLDTMSSRWLINRIILIRPEDFAKWSDGLRKAGLPE
jgi:hypothetical protein